MIHAALRDRFEAALRGRLGTRLRILDAAPLSGGDTNTALRLVTNEGLFFAKHHPSIDARFSAEKLQLDRLRAACSGLEIPEVIAAEDAAMGSVGFLLTRFLSPAARRPDFDETLGRGLAELHRASASGFGFEMPTPCGATIQPNPWTSSWVRFFCEHRLGFAFRALHAAGRISSETRKDLERSLEQLEAQLREPEQSSLVHGDLWSGNVRSTDRGPAIFDPAAYYADREAELGMMRLFGNFGPRVYAAYEEAWPLDPGHARRVRIYRLWHIANHALLFGGSYVRDMAEEVRTLVG